MVVALTPAMRAAARCVVIVTSWAGVTDLLAWAVPVARMVEDTS
jgi:hypothetical protein